MEVLNHRTGAEHTMKKLVGLYYDGGLLTKCPRGQKQT